MNKQVIISDQNSDRKYFCILQNILSRIELTAFERSLYWAIKESCGEKGTCTKSYASLAKMSGMCQKSVQRTLFSLSEINKHILKPLILITNRLSENGDKDTNEIVLTDLWEDNCKVFKEIIGQVSQTSPKVNNTIGQVSQTPGVRSHRPEGQVSQTYKQEPFTKNPLPRTTTTTNKPSSSSSPSALKEISLEAKSAAKKAHEYLKNRAVKCPDENWNLDLGTLEKNFQIYGINRATDNLNYLVERMEKFRKNKSKQSNTTQPIDDPKSYFTKACKENYANTIT